MVRAGGKMVRLSLDVVRYLIFNVRRFIYTQSSWIGTDIHWTPGLHEYSKAGQHVITWSYFTCPSFDPWMAFSRQTTRRRWIEVHQHRPPYGLLELCLCAVETTMIAELALLIFNCGRSFTATQILSFSCWYPSRYQPEGTDCNVYFQLQPEVEGLELPIFLFIQELNY